MIGSAVLITPAALLGLAIGSFLNVLVYRVPRRESVLFPGSHCPACRTPIKNRHNIPVLSWLLLRGRCAYCHGAISVRYPIVEAATAAVFGGAAAGYWPCALFGLVAAVWLVAVLALRQAAPDRADIDGAGIGVPLVRIPTTHLNQSLEGATPWPR